MPLIIDPEFKALIPAITAAEYNGLQEDIIAHGCLSPIIVWGEIIVDGHNRFEICTEFKKAFKTQRLEFADRDDAKAWIIKHQLGRRNLNTSQRAIMAAQLSTLGRGQPEKKSANLPNTLPTQEENANKMAVSTRSVTAAKAVLAEGTPEQIAAVTNGEKSVSAVVAEIRQPEPEPEPAPTVDCVGYELPENPKIKEAFSRREEVQAFLSKLTQIKKEIRAEHEAGKENLWFKFSLSSFQTALQRCFDMVKATRPYAVCPYCNGDGCQACKDLGWLGEFEYAAVPRELKRE